MRKFYSISLIFSIIYSLVCFNRQKSIEDFSACVGKIWGKIPIFVTSP